MRSRGCSISEAIVIEARRRGSSMASSEHAGLGLRRAASLNELASLDEYAEHDEAKRPPCLGLSIARKSCLLFHGPRHITSSQDVTVRRIAVQDSEGSSESLPLFIQSDNDTEEPAKVFCGDDVSIFLDRDQMPCSASHIYAQHIVEVHLPWISGEPQLWWLLKFMDKSLEELTVLSRESPDSLQLCLAEDRGRKWLRVDEALDAPWHVVEGDV
eukprot:CAMPEP_0172900146 /NCGR_PEP_ID=MMETSP1075-20121228/163403_1 /TAXON_ID=2916 /ORGANISM="Ceratium fusus, Strain PA161109" /LENGTH=213 /DNA_ID=CAMNT_0013756267 /DNA_START=112 /DNA_END=753 /DNA_ORIENTATION=-